MDTTDTVPSPSILDDSLTTTQDDDEFESTRSFTSDSEEETETDFSSGKYGLSVDEKGQTVLKNYNKIHLTRLSQDERIPYTIDGNCAFTMTGPSKGDLLSRTRDGRPWRS